MKITYLTEYDPFNPDVLSGTSYWIAKSLGRDATLQPYHITPPEKLLPPMEELAFRAKQQWIRFYQRAHLDPDLLFRRAHYIAKSTKNALANQRSDIILSALSPVASAFLETDRPIVYWTDALYAGLIASNPGFRYHHPDTMVDAHYITNACLTNARLLIFSSSWAARTAVEYYGIAKDKIRVVPFGANLDISHKLADVKAMIAARSHACIKLLFVAKEWHSKGGDIVLRIAHALTIGGYKVEVTIIGCIPPDKHLPSYVTCLPFLSKRHAVNVDKLKQYYQESHFLFVPSRAEAFGIVFCEANAFGLPCITTHVGGIPDVVKDGINGMTFSLEATIAQYCDYITHLMEHRAEYEALALSAYNEYETRLNWTAASQLARQYMADIL